MVNVIGRNPGLPWLINTVLILALIVEYQSVSLKLVLTVVAGGVSGITVVSLLLVVLVVPEVTEVLVEAEGVVGGVVVVVGVVVVAGVDGVVKYDSRSIPNACLNTKYPPIAIRSSFISVISFPFYHYSLIRMLVLQFL